MAQALVPLKDLVSAKTRLSGVLRPAERRALAQAMVEDVLTVLTGHPSIDRVTLVSDDPGADLLACKYGIDVVDEKSLGCHGLNPVIDKACDRLMDSENQQFLVLHGDIPLLSAADIDAVLKAQAESRGLVIGCDLQLQGSNLLAFDKGSRPQFSFGPGSCSLHSDSSSESGIPVTIINRPGIGLDVDDAADLALLITKLRAGRRTGHTASLLLQTELGRRMEMLLPGLDNTDWITERGRTNYE